MKIGHAAMLAPLLLLLATSLAASAGAAEPAPSAERGKTLYLTAGCKHCHGTVGQGSSAGRRLAPKPLPAAAITQFIRATGTNMPAYSASLLNDAAVADIAAYLASIPASPQPDQIPVLRDLTKQGKGNP
jgi:mono/diheme cytochrome c family protein